MVQLSSKPRSEYDAAKDRVRVNPTLLDKENVQPLHVAKEKTVALRQRAGMPVLDSIDSIEQSSSICTENAQPLQFAQQEAGSPQKKRRGSWERATATLAEQGRGLPVPWQRLAEAGRQQEELGKTAAENKARRKEAARRGAAERPTERERDERAAAAARASRSARDEQATAKRGEAADEAAAAARERNAEAMAEEKAAAEPAKLEAEEKVSEWCKKNRYPDMHTQKKTFQGATKFPLHTAVKHNNSRMISMMLLAGAHKDVRDSKMQTPIQLAAKLNKDGSHNFIIAMLQEFNPPTLPGHMLS